MHFTVLLIKAPHIGRSEWTFYYIKHDYWVSFLSMPLRRFKHDHLRERLDAGQRGFLIFYDLTVHKCFRPQIVFIFNNMLQQRNVFQCKDNHIFSWNTANYNPQLSTWGVVTGLSPQPRLLKTTTRHPFFLALNSICLTYVSPLPPVRPGCNNPL